MIRKVAALCLLVCLAAGGAVAADWPELYDVSGVKAGDVLNVRAEPNASSDIVGTLSPDATGVEVIRTNDEGTWGLVNTGERAGWVALAYLARQPGQSANGEPEIGQCFGTEPFWSLKIDRPKMSLTMPDAPDTGGLVSSFYKSASLRNRFALVGYLMAKDAGELETTAFFSAAACNDGMSDKEYGIAVDLLIRDNSASDGLRRSRFYSGCCTIRPPAR